MFYKKVIPGSTSRLTVVDHQESYGRHILAKLAGRLEIKKCLDLGCGQGDDLQLVKRQHLEAELFGVDFSSDNEEMLKARGIKPLILNIENERLPFPDESLDLIIANQFLEHTKEIFWINHEIFRCLKVGGRFFMGVPNVLSGHNRLLMAAGYHPTAHKLISAHVRVFSKKDVRLFYKTIGASFSELEQFSGAQFYPFPKVLARFLARLFPTLAFSIFFVFKKIGPYRGEFLAWPSYAKLETNFFTGPGESEIKSQT